MILMNIEGNNRVQTPVQKLNKFLGNELYVKREDLYPYSFGGNKVRKAIIFFDDLIKKEFDCVITYGSSSSNHCRIIANLAAAKGIPCHIISPLQSNYLTFNTKIIKMFDAILSYCQISEVKATIDRKIEELKFKGYKPYFIQGGGHGDIGTQAYVNVYNEIVEYELNNEFNFDYIFHATGTGTTQAGLVCGKLLKGDTREIVGISIARKNPHGGNVVLESVNSYFKSLSKKPVTIDEINFADDFVLNGYGSYNKQILQSIKDVLTYDGVPLDTTYTGKAFWGMKEYIKKNQIKDKKILFIHTGGTPLFFDKLGDLTDDE
ncbi:1-aminocyclopropane-1-carboxylate deaminase/D-cysteine desulfhydrase [Texcoconibacillus texcoconensis]|uniref:D-cysteine desulfhydrase n=1 Tax=Texcoconibacillus texcoconensis TaxID=1095777 RepID=A0A840QT72_9BACI|nr:pyridoxal-phosphate dependent enzyme [Texcoconibacillus texcoconensis]MBB5174565.1 D-cysteine desulfhydrase [Texcoconibacillus texcoconensis]